MDGEAVLGALAIGFYSIQIDRAPAVTLAVIAPLRALPPPSSPIGIDGAASWFYSRPWQWNAVANLMRIAGVNWVRDRYHMAEVEPQPGALAEHTRYDDSTQIFHGAGLHILDTSEDAAPWTHAPPHRFPDDLRDVYSSFRGIAARWRGKVGAFEPWNEPDFSSSGAEIASFQKAAYLGMKAGNPAVIVCMAPFAKPVKDSGPGVASEFKRNNVGPYFDSFNFHHYVALEFFQEVYDDFRAISAGKPLWASEFNIPVPVTGNLANHDPSPEDMRSQALTVAKLYSSALFQGDREGFYFVLGDYIQTKPDRVVQFGILHKDLTPRPAFLALAAVGRLLAGASALGRLRGATTGQGAGHDSIFAFSALPDGQRREVLVAWSDHGDAHLTLPQIPEAIYNALGQEYPRLQTPANLTLTESPVFVVLPAGSLQAWKSRPIRAHAGFQLASPPASPQMDREPPSSVVLQAVFSAQQLVFGKNGVNTSAERLGSQSPQIFAYNFSSKALRVKIEVSVPSGWRYRLGLSTLTIPPNGRVELPFLLKPVAGSRGLPAIVNIQATGPGVGLSVLSFSVLSNSP